MLNNLRARADAIESNCIELVSCLSCQSFYSKKILALV
jgi:hypothetical protein